MMGKKTRPLHYLDQQEYWEESGRLDETCWHSSSSEKQPANADVKNSQKSKVIIKLAQKCYKARHDWALKLVNWELCKRLKF